MTDNDIIKALECCSEPAGKCCCEECPLYHREDSCTTALIKMSVELVNRQKAEIERYKGVIKLLESDVQTAKTEAVKEFAERLKTRCEIFYPNVYLNLDDIDNLVKEMTEQSVNYGSSKTEDGNG